MSKELEIRRQFLDEAQDYLDALDAAVMGLAGGRIDIQKINAALRSAHSIKGGAGLMGFHLLSQLAHRLEDSFKVLKTQHQSIQIDAALENLLLSGIDCLRTIIYQHQQDQPLNPDWTEYQVEPIFQQLHDRLGDPVDEDAVSVLSTDSGQDVIALLFETEVEDCLQRLEAVLANPNQPCLQEELIILAQEMGGLGKMLQLHPFTQLCVAIEQITQATPELIPSIAQAALKAWRRSQTLILNGQIDLLPSLLEEDLFSVPTPTTTSDEFAIAKVASTEVTKPEIHSTEILITETDEVTESDISSIAPDDQPIFDSVITQEYETDSFQVDKIPKSQSANFRFEANPDVTATSLEADQNATVRVSVRQLNQFNDFLSELTIERNGLSLYLKRLRNLAHLLMQRVRLLEQSNTQLQTVYDRIIPRTIGISRVPLLPPTNNDSTFNATSNPEAFSASVSPISSSFAREFDILELDQYNELHLLSQQVMETIVQIQEVSADIDLSLDDAEQTVRELNKTGKQLQANLTQIRMRPLSDIVNRFPRALREWSLQYGKQVKLIIKGGSTLIERTILEALSDPLMHLLRNAFDHGIETPETRRSQGKPEEGTIEIQATHHGNRTLITISDDGKGISLDKIRAKAEQIGLDPTLLATADEADLLSLIFEPGFSTSDRVTDLSGRGVGLDVVRDNLRQIRGEICVNTRAGLGTTFTLSVPFTLSVVRVLLAESNGILLAFPTDAIKETLLLTTLPSLENGEDLVWREQTIKRIELSRWLQFNCPRQPVTLETAPSIDAPTILIANQGNQQVAIQVERTWGEQEVAVRRTEGNLAMPEGFTGCAIVADGRVVPLVNVTELVDWIVSCDRDSKRSSTLTSFNIPKELLKLNRELLPITATPNSAIAKSTVLIVDDSINIRRFLALTLEKAGFRVEQAKDGLDAIDKLQRGSPVQAVICDIEMPRMDGFGFLAKFKSNPQFEQIPVAMLTSRTGEKHRQLAMSLGASAYFSKPYNEQELLQTLESIIKASSPMPI
ncbi:chemotaxis protein histidine kinase-like protein [Leptolyngbyaceae cyanobacterium JSC-12]|nr:chemotaxis protein histidine kinase-like protein [Leptolyngbyaceae cyanobacterium JSC-12]